MLKSWQLLPKRGGSRAPRLLSLGRSTRCCTSNPTRLRVALTATRAVILLLSKRWYLLLPTLTRICVHVRQDRCCEAKHRFRRISFIGYAMFQRRRIPNSSVINSVSQTQYLHTNSLNVYSRYFNTWRFWKRGPGSSVGIATGYGLDGPEIEPRWGRDFPHLSRPALGPT
jgi:hypothetical protein